jgi:hypothetical protein
MLLAISADKPIRGTADVAAVLGAEARDYRGLRRSENLTLEKPDCEIINIEITLL